uniref:Alpha-1,4 glucan phosphorylase n=1 Tax=Picocystis salinarum TaxID=88271 RepID=A0A6U9Q3J5_9CHLO|mmetsp:Transcript_8091/g.50021  ORF Transcript_8091/g.50021 Transcript_8091/m.50021 type:complete len:843 (-) Transcript_8091:3866-6394(-)
MEQDETGWLSDKAVRLYKVLSSKRGGLHPHEAYQAMAEVLHERLLEPWTDTQAQLEGARNQDNHHKEVGYLSLEFLAGRTLQQVSCNLQLDKEFKLALMELGIHLEDLVEEEADPGLGNGGLGRLASCFLDSMATLELPAWGYGLRYRFGMFEQVLHGGKQGEKPDPWLRRGNPWEVQRRDLAYPVHFYGRVSSQKCEQGRQQYKWHPGETVRAVAYDTPIPGHSTTHTNTMRLWRSMAMNEFQLDVFNQGKHVEAFEEEAKAEAITSVLYPNDTTQRGKVLRLKQQYFLVSATLQDILHRLQHLRKIPASEMSNHVALQLNDTHPALAVPELMRLLLDGEACMGWEQAWQIVTSVFSYTNHTILPEALEKWPVPLMEELLPRHMQIIYEINHRHLQSVCSVQAQDDERMARLSIIEESQPKSIRMAMLAAVASKHINGVATLHSGLVRSRLFPDLAYLQPHKFVNVTNGVSPRRWILVANPSLTRLLDLEFSGRTWLKPLSNMRKLIGRSIDPVFQAAWQDARKKNKERLASYIHKKRGMHVNVNALFDVHAKRIHEYKRQLMNILALVYRYRQILEYKSQWSSNEVPVPHFMNPRVVIFSGKAAPGYVAAKQIIQLALGVSRTINSDAAADGTLQVVFLPNYNVSLAELLVPAADVSQHISTAGMEASGTSNIKFAMNGGLLLATMDGATIEIADVTSATAVVSFGASEAEVKKLRVAQNSCAMELDPRLSQVLEMIDSGLFGPPEDYDTLLDAIRTGNDYFMIAKDFASYLHAQQQVDELFLQKEEWTRRSICTAASMSTFSSDRAVMEYADRIWGTAPSDSHAKARPNGIHGHFEKHG